MAGTQRAEQLFYIRDRACARSEPGEGVATPGEGAEQRQREQRGAPSPVAGAAVGWRGQRVLRGDVRG